MKVQENITMGSSRSKINTYHPTQQSFSSSCKCFFWAWTDKIIVLCLIKPSATSYMHSLFGSRQLKYSSLWQWKSSQEYSCENEGWGTLGSLIREQTVQRNTCRALANLLLTQSFISYYTKCYKLTRPKQLGNRCIDQVLAAENEMEMQHSGQS